MKLGQAVKTCGSLVVLAFCLASWVCADAWDDVERSLNLLKRVSSDASPEEARRLTLEGQHALSGGEGSDWTPTAVSPESLKDPAAMKARMLKDLDFIASSFEAQYAPADWKKRHLGWDLTEEVKKAQEEIESSPEISVKKYQGIVKRLIQSTKDYHVNVQFANTESASLPFTVQEAKGRYFIVWINRSKLSESAFPFEVGDELIEFDGRKTGEVVQELQRALGDNTKETDRALAALMLTGRSAASGMDVPKGAFRVAVKRKGSHEVVTHQLIWEHSPESVQPQPGLTGWVKFEDSGSSVAKFLDLFSNFRSPLQDQLSSLEQVNPFGLGTRQSYIPELGVKIWESDPKEPFHAYIYRSPLDGKLIGYVRISSYGSKDIPGAVQSFAKITEKFEKTTDGLVIDQINNPGGSLFYLYALASMLTDKSLATPKERIAITQNEVAGAARTLELAKFVKNDEDARKFLGETLHGYPVTYQTFLHVIEYARSIISEWNAGRTLTSPMHVYGIDEVNPSTMTASRYTKPILLLVNELDFSGGDFFPAILQDNKRAKVFGTRTAGAGGFLFRIRHSNLLGIAGFSITGSLAERVDNNPIENLGVRPDIGYALTEADLQEGYKDYVKAINQAVGDLLKGDSQPSGTPPAR